MSDGEKPRVDRAGIHIDRDLAKAVAIEEELDANVEGEYVFPDPRRRRTAAWVLDVAALAAVAAIDGSGGWLVGAGLAVLSLWLFLSSWPLEIDETEALAKAAASVSFPVGHAAASLRFQGWRSRPAWSVVVYSANEPPDERALVVIDAVDGALVGQPYVEAMEPV
ncbi:MAG TPA: hypothetical protein EYP73_07835 [Acidimicrobiia bacterium]|nr:hypothetical protein [Acidimicrobiia bacterium]